MQAPIGWLLFKCCREALVTVGYADGKFRTGPKAGQPKLSIAFGSQTPEVFEGDVLPGVTLAKQKRAAVVRLLNDVSEREATLNRKLKTEIKPSQYGMLLSGYYQKGSALLDRVGGLFNEGKPDEAIWAMTEFPFDGEGKWKPGLAKRRAGEMTGAWTDNLGDTSRYRLYTVDPNKHPQDYQWADTAEIAALIRELDPTRAD